MSTWLAERTIFLALGGSRAHGTAGEGSDLDLRGACIAPLAVRVSPWSRFEQHEGPLPEGLSPHLPKDAPERVEVVLYDLAKLVTMLAAQNPNALELLFSDERDWLFASPAWRRLFAERRRFLTTRVRQTYAGYAQAQLARIRTHRGWLLEPPKGPPSRADFGLSERPVLSRDVQGRIDAAVRERMAAFRLDDLVIERATRIELDARLGEVLAELLGVELAALPHALEGVAQRALHLPEAVTHTLEAERRYRRALAEWHAYLSHEAKRNPARAALEARFGYDTKHAMHLVRLYRTGIEVLETGELKVRRPDAAELRAIKDGALSYDELIQLTRVLDARLEHAAKTTTLPSEVDRAWLEPFLVELLLGRAL